MRSYVCGRRPARAPIRPLADGVHHAFRCSFLAKTIRARDDLVSSCNRILAFVCTQPSPPGGLPVPKARGPWEGDMTRSTIRRSNPSSGGRRRPAGRSAAAGLVLVLAATLLPVTAVRAADPEVPPAVDPGTPTYVGLDDPVPDGPVAFDPTRNMLQAFFDADEAAGGDSYWIDRCWSAPVRAPAAPASGPCTPRAVPSSCTRTARTSSDSPARARAPTRAAAASAIASRSPKRHEPLHGDGVGRRADRAGCRPTPVSEPLVERPHRRRPAGRPAQVHHREQRRGHDPHADEYRQRADHPHDHRGHPRSPSRSTATSASAASTPATT